jgi:hypothetical protein
MSTSHFYAGISGSRGPATRMGNKDSGISAYAQGLGSRISVGMHYNRTEEHDDGSIVLSGGYTSNANINKAIHLPNIDAIVMALDSGDPKMARIWERIQNEFDKLSSEAPSAIVRQERKREKEAREERREQERLRNDRKKIAINLEGAMKLRLHKLLGVEFDEDGIPLDFLPFGPDYGNLRYDIDGETVLIEACVHADRRWEKFTFDVTNGEWVLPFTAAEIGIEDDVNHSGYTWRVAV